MIVPVKKKMKEFQISKCLEDIFFYIDELNKYMDESQPWNSFKIDPKKAGKDLSILIECFRVIRNFTSAIYSKCFKKDFRYFKYK